MDYTLDKELVQESNYSKYLEQLKNYYDLKKKYTSRKQTFIKKLINSNDSIESKKKLYSRNKFKCINCNKEGGTIFLENNKMLRATCGNTSNPCKLNLEIIKMNSVLIDNELKEANISLINKKKEITLTKLNYLYNYIDEDKAVELFEHLKTELGTLQENYNNLILLYNSITNNTDTENLLNEKLEEQNSLINEFKEFIKLFKDTQETRYLKDALFIYTNKLKTLTEHIAKLKYKYSKIETDEEHKYLIQNKYNIKNLELIKKPTV
tara:strand:- start:486 stop:1283 length:798 start_codon:yes stop_codon:yes gene_type:complete